MQSTDRSAPHGVTVMPVGPVVALRTVFDAWTTLRLPAGQMP
jgi:hypothetical protein